MPETFRFRNCSSLSRVYDLLARSAYVGLPWVPILRFSQSQVLPQKEMAVLKGATFGEVGTVVEMVYVGVNLFTSLCSTTFPQKGGKK